ncbi:hypothetical protein [Polluticoccus soli]|uniref:hypothetical protein n=1 Tax=Polluticoccus soli TaxID=3034150 RepID=UPI0023E2E23D|nr:hypothetical protein [Flavipsychrobacter sp. JY13-12]
MKKLFILITLLAAASTTQAQRYRGFNEHPKFRIGLQGGWSYRLAKVSDQVPPGFRTYVEKLKPGYNYGADGSFFFSRALGVGIRYSGYRTSNSMDIEMLDTATYNLIQGKMSDDITVSYVGPTFNLRYISESEIFHFVSTFSLGYLSYTDKTLQITPLKLQSATVGVVVGAAADFAVHENIFLGAEVSLLTGNLTYYDVEINGTSQHEELPENQYESLSRIDVSAGVRFNF